MNSSLRLRLVLIILIPLLLIAGIVSAIAVYDAQQRAAERFDRSLLSAVLAISRDVALSGGDALSPETNSLLQDTSGGLVFYHVYAPDGVFVTGYATPPVAPSQQTGVQTYYDSRYQGEDVRVLRFTDAMQIEGLSGEFTFTVWQDAKLRDAIVADLSRRTFQIISSLIAAVALVVWFGVRLGLRPLLALENAIALRSADDLTAIRRKVPVEARGIVNTLNRLFGQVSSTLTAKDVFISNAAHQLRNPIAGVVAMSEAVASAKTIEDMRERSQELAKASRRAGDLAEKLLTLERASAAGLSAQFKPVDLNSLLTHVTDQQAKASKIKLTKQLPDNPIMVNGDETMLTEAVTNLIENARLHGGPNVSEVTVTLTEKQGQIALTIQDDGIGIAAEDLARARERFGQIHPSQGSGLGLAIADAVAQQHGGEMIAQTGDKGLRVTLALPTLHQHPAS